MTVDRVNNGIFSFLDEVSQLRVFLYLLADGDMQ